MTTFYFHPSISMTISSAWYKSCRTIIILKVRKIGLLSKPFTLVMLVILQDCLLSMFVNVVATKVITHFNDNGKGLKAYKQETKKSKWWTVLTRNVFWGDINCFASLKPILRLYEKSSSSNTNFQKGWHYQLLKDFREVSFIDLFASNHWELNTYVI